MGRVFRLYFFLASFLVLKASSIVLEDNYLGCFRKFAEQSLIISQSMNINSCIETCRNNGSTFAGLQRNRRNRCLCGEDFGQLEPETKCAEVCSGNSSQYCGGLGGTAVYSVCGIGYYGTECNEVCHCGSKAPCNRTTGSCPTGCDRNWLGSTCNTANVSPMNLEWYIGCYADTSQRVMVSAYQGENSGNWIHNSITYCIIQCARNNNTYIGVQYEWNCFCGESYSKYGTSDNCNIRCQADKTQICGGSWANSVYSVCPIGSFSSNCLRRCNCANNARCIYNSGACPEGCEPGWTGDSCNIRNCRVANGSCNGPNEFCETIDLKYTTKTGCGCKEGYTRVKPWDDCTDVDECQNKDSACGYGAYNCTNTDGGFICAYCPDDRPIYSDNGTCVAPELSNCYFIDFRPMIIGLTLGSVLVLVIIVAIVIVCIRRKNKRSNGRTSNHEKHSIDFEEEGIMQEQNRIYESPYENECTYENMKTSGTQIRVEDISRVVEQLVGTPGALEKEFKSVPESSDAACMMGKRKDLKKKNRFKNILPYDHNRVILSNIDSQSRSDYINASYITTSNNTSDRLIASQGPTPETLNDFWQMIFGKRVTVIAMVTNLYENGKNKCEKYWPELGNVKKFGDLTVNTVSERKWQNFERRSLLLVSQANPYELQNSETQTLEIAQWQYTSWPDHGVPINIRSFLTFRRKVRKSMSPDSYTVIHCSAGAGRTGSYIAIDYLLEEGKTGFVDVSSCLRNLRQQRTQMIQTLEQYKFVYIALMDAFSTGDTVLRRDDYEEQLDKLRIKDPISGISKLGVQFEMLNRLKASANRNSESLKAIEVQSTLPNANYIIKAISPTETSGDLWKLCADHRSKLFVFVNESQEAPPFIPTQGSPVAVSDFNLILDSVTEESCVTICQATMLQQTESVYANQTDSSEAHKITLLSVHVKSSPSRDSVDYESLSAAYATVRRFSRNPSGPIIIMSRDDERLSGFFVAAFNAFDMITDENEVDVYQIVHDLRMSNPRFVPTLSVYEDLHEFIRQHVKHD